MFQSNGIIILYLVKRPREIPLGLLYAVNSREEMGSSYKAAPHRGHSSR